jgi:hypothetical protein
MTEELTVTGGAQIGWVHASWPFARLSVSPRSLVVSGGLIGSYRFTPEQVAALEPYGSIPILYRGVRVVHSNPDYPSKIVFWCFQNPARLIERIRQVRFIPRASAATVQTRKGMPMRWSFILVLVVVWNALFFLDGFVPWKEPKAPGPPVLLALALVFSTAFAVRRSALLQSWVLKSGRSVGEIRPVLLLVQFVTGFMLVIFILIVAVGRRAG